MSTLHHLPSKTVQLYLVPVGLFLIFTLASHLQIHAAEVVMHTDTITFDGPSMSGASCDCGGTSQPPWHGSVRGRCCNRPCCPPPTMFHADACGQLRAKDEAKAHCVELPSAFPKFHDILVDGHRLGRLLCLDATIAVCQHQLACKPLVR